MKFENWNRAITTCDERLKWPMKLKGHCLRLASTTHIHSCCSFHRYLSLVHMFFILNYWKHNRMNVYMMFSCNLVSPLRPPVQQGRIIDIWAWTITNSRPEKEQINVFDRIFKLTVINVDMFKFPFYLSIMCDMVVFLQFRKQ